MRRPVWGPPCRRIARLTRASTWQVREALSVWRNKPGLIAFLLIPTCLNLIYANIFYRVGDVRARETTPHEAAHSIPHT